MGERGDGRLQAVIPLFSVKPGRRFARVASSGIQRRYVLTALCLVLLLGAITRLELLSSRALWIDEALTLDLVSGGPSQIVATSRLSEPHPPGYYLLLWAWQAVVGSGPTAARIPSLIFGLLSILLTWSVGGRLSPAGPALVAAAVVAVHPFQVVASNEIRMYPLLTAAGLAATLALVEAVRRPARAGLWALYGALAAGVAYVSYYGFLLLAGHALGVVIVLAGSRNWRGPAAAGASALLCYAPWIPSLLTSITSNPVPWRPPVSLSYLLGMVLTQTFGGYVLGTPAYHASGPATVWWYLLGLPLAIVLAAGVVHALRCPRIGPILVCSWLVPLSLAAAASLILNKEAAYYYHLTYVQPYGALLMALGIVSIARQAPAPSRNWLVLGCVAVTLTGVGLATHVAQSGSRDVYRFDLAARWLQRRYLTGDVTIYFAHVGERVMRWYLRPVGPEVVISVSPHRWTLDDVRPLLQQAVAPLRVTHRRVWLVLTPPTPRGSVEELVRLLTEKGYRPTREGVDYGGVFVQLFERGAR